MLSVGLLTGGYGEDELRGAGAFRVYRDAAELLDSLDELGSALSPDLTAGRAVTCARARVDAMTRPTRNVDH